jgi:Mg-chelatase subunit ChlD
VIDHVRARVAMCLVLLAVTLGGCVFDAGPTAAPVGIVSSTPAPRTQATRSILLVIDKSGSMSFDPLGGIPPIEMAKVAAQDVLARVGLYDRFGVLAFNDEQEWIVGLSQLQHETLRQHAASAIDGLSADGGTGFFPALALAIAQTMITPSEDRQIVFITDGKSRSGTREEYQQLIALATGAEIKISTVGTGANVDTEVLEFVAEQGGGRYHFAEDAEDIPAAVALALGLSPATPSTANATPASVGTLRFPVSILAQPSHHMNR